MRRVVIIGLLSVLAVLRVSAQQSGSPASNAYPPDSSVKSFQVRSVGTDLDGTNVSDDSIFQDTGSLEAECESNGPEGSRGIPMQRLSLKQFALALGIMLASWGVLVLDKRLNGSDKQRG